MLSGKAHEVLDCLIQLYHNMVVHRLSYGILTSVATLLLVHIDWKHTKHPGQIVSVAMHDHELQHIKPKHPDLCANQHHHVHIIAALCLEQQTGPHWAAG